MCIRRIFYILIISIFMLTLAQSQENDDLSANVTDTTLGNLNPNENVSINGSEVAVDEQTPEDPNAVSSVDVSIWIEEFEATTAIFADNMPEKPSDKVRYKILVQNTGGFRLNNVVLTTTLAKRMKYENSSYLDPNDGIISKPKRSPNDYDERSKTGLDWDIGILEPGAIKGISLGVLVEDGANMSDVTAKVTATSNGKPISDSVDLAKYAQISDAGCTPIARAKGLC
jgi:uncharacterized repeat protein (TIGR01451 family)